MAEYQDKYEKLLEEKKKVELEFGLARRRFKELYVDCENQLNNEKENSRQLEIQLKDLTKQVHDCKVENEGIRIAVQISEEAKQEEYMSIRAKHEEEVASIQHIFKEASMENQNRLTKEFEDERKKLTNANALLKQKLKTVVEPLETEILSLKKQLIDVNNVQFKGAEASKGRKDLNGELKEAQKDFESEKSARTDLEMYVAVLNTQKTVLQEDADKLKRELHNVCRLFEQEKMNHNELKQTWKLANEQFLTQQEKLVAELELTKKVLSPEQIEHLSKGKYIKGSNVIRTVAEHPYQVSSDSIPSEEYLDSQNSSNLIDFDSSSDSTTATSNKDVLEDAKNQPKRDFKDDILSAFFPAAYQARHFNQLLVEDNGVKEQPLILSSSSDSEGDYEQPLGMEKIEKNVTSEKGDSTVVKRNPGLAILDDYDDNDNVPHQKSDPSDDVLFPKSKDMCPNQNNTSILKNTDLPKEEDFVERLNSDDSVWNSMSHDYSETCMMCQNYEKQLQRLQKDNMTLQEIGQRKADDLNTLQEQLNSEKDSVSALEKTIETMSSDCKKQLTIYEKNQKEVDKQVQLLKDQFQEFQLNILIETRKVSENTDGDNV